jgi:hypothetical protein
MVTVLLGSGRTASQEHPGADAGVEEQFSKPTS